MGFIFIWRLIHFHKAIQNIKDDNKNGKLVWILPKSNFELWVRLTLDCQLDYMCIHFKSILSKTSSRPSAQKDICFPPVKFLWSDVPPYLEIQIRHLHPMPNIGHGHSSTFASTPSAMLILNLALLNQDRHCLWKQCSSRSDRSGSTLFVIQFVNLYEQTTSSYLIGWQSEVVVANLIYSAG